MSRAAAPGVVLWLALLGAAMTATATDAPAPVTGPSAAGLPAAGAPLQFENAAEEARFRRLAAELRCVMCQNQSLADSDAPIAHDLRRIVLEQIRAGRSDEGIKTFLVERYGDFVLYDPPVKPATWLLWFGPALILLAGAVTVVLVVRRRGAGVPAGTPREDEQEW